MLRHNTPWSTKEVRLLKEAYEQGDSLETLANKLGRSELAVRAQVIRLRRRGDGPPLRRTPLHGVSAKGCHPVIRRIFEVAKLEGHTYQSLASRVGVSRGAIASLIERNPSFHTVVAVAQALDIEIRPIYDRADKTKSQVEAFERDARLAQAAE